MYGLVKKATTNLFEEWKSTEEDKVLKEQSASFLASGVGAFGNVGGAVKSLGFDPFATYREAIGRGQGKLLFQTQQAFAPLLNEIRWNSNILNLATGDVFLRNSEGLAIGTGIGAVIQGIATAIYPPLAPLWMVFPWLFGMLGVGIQEGSIALDPGGFTPYNPGGGYGIADAIADANKPALPPTDPGGGVDIFVEPGSSFIPQSSGVPFQLPQGTTGRIQKIWMLELTDAVHWL